MTVAHVGPAEPRTGFRYATSAGVPPVTATNSPYVVGKTA